MMTRRQLLAEFVLTAGGLLMPEPARRVVYAFAPSQGWDAVALRARWLAEVDALVRTTAASNGLGGVLRVGEVFRADGSAQASYIAGGLYGRTDLWVNGTVHT